MNQNKLLIGGTFIYVGAMCFFLLENAFTQFKQELKGIGVILLVIGGITTIIGILSDKQKILTIQPPKDRNCLNCGKAIPFEASICPYCKFDFEQSQVDFSKTS
jgi:predicted Zn-ribbon and HTH transcriptional regulator